MDKSVLNGARATQSPDVSCSNCPLRQRPVFRDKTAKEIQILEDMKIEHRRMGAGADIIYAGQEDAELFTLYRGWAFRQKTLPDGRRQILHFLLPGDLIGLQASLMDAADHGIEALTDVELCVFSRRKTWDYFASLPTLAYEMAWLGAREEGMLDENLTSVGQRSASERIATLVLSLYRRAEGLGLVKDKTFLFPLSRQHMADALGLSLVHTIKTWSALRRSGLFVTSGNMLTLVNPHLTERMASYFDREREIRPIL